MEECTNILGSVQMYGGHTDIWGMYWGIKHTGDVQMFGGSVQMYGAIDMGDVWGVQT